ncbi:MAG: hypothetical protein Fur0020_07580 [Thermodesulfovibrionia bacterium]
MKISDKERWELMPWLWVILCSLFIFLTIPLARGIQGFVYNNIGKEAFTYIILFVILAGLMVSVYLFAFRLGIRRPSQYIWLIICAGLYGYFTIMLKGHPEEAFHLLEYGLLSYLFFVAISKRVHDHLIYVISILFVFLISILDEFIQWMVPERFWDFKDVGTNALSSVIFMLGLWRGVQPSYINKPVRWLSVKVLLFIMTIDLFFLGFCLSNTPRVVGYYTERIRPLSWLRDEEPMVEYGYKHTDPDIGIIYSRLTLRQIKDMDTLYGDSYGLDISDALNRGITYKDLMEFYKPPKDPFVYEFIIHLQRRDETLKDLEEIGGVYLNMRGINTILKENLILERYFTNTLRHSGYAMPDDVLKVLKDKALMGEGMYISNVGRLITAFDLKSAWAIILIIIVALWMGAIIHTR